MIFFSIFYEDYFLDEPEVQSFDPMSPDVAESPMEQAYMSDGDYEAISSEDEFIDIDTDVVSGY